MAYPERWLSELMARNDIVSVISEYTRLSSRGGRMWGLCPFHPERDPSFSVSPDKQLFHCFSCKAGGSVIQFIEQAENLSYHDAIRFLAQRVGMDMPNEVDDERLRAEKARRDRLYNANREAALFYHKALLSDIGADARKYLIGRGIDGSTAVKFGLGYSPNDWDALYKHLSSLGFSRDDLIDAGLCVKGRKDPESTFDFFHDRLMFPVINSYGRVVAFGGRVLSGGDGAKYMNTGDTPIYNKKHNIYGINLMKGRKLSDLIMVEGYMDVISLHQAGIDNAVASLGTALTSQQAKLLGRFAPGVYYAYDGDSAGQKAMLRGIDVLEASGIEPKVIKIPEGRDPDEYVQAYGAEAFMLLKDSAMTSSMFKLEYMAAKYDFSTPDGREKYAREACSFIAGLEPIERERYIKLVSERSGMAPDTLRAQCGAEKPMGDAEKHTVIQGAYRRRQAQSERVKAEQLLLASLMVSRADANLIVQSKDFSYSLFSSDSLREFSEMLMNAYKSTEKPDIAKLLAVCESADIEQAGAAADMIDNIVSPVETASDCIRSILKTEYDERIRELSRLAEEETDPGKRQQLMSEQLALVMKSREIR